MRKIRLSAVLCYAGLQNLVFGLAGLTVYWLLWHLPLGDFRGIGLTLAGIVLIYAYTLLAYRAFLWVMPLQEGELAPGSRGEFAAQVNILFYLVIFNTLVRTNFMPVPLMRLVYLALGAKMGTNTYSPGALLDPPLTVLGANVMIGHNATLFAHAIEGDHFSLKKIVVGDNVTIGAQAIVMSGVEIGAGAIVSAGAVVRKDTKIGPGEIWGGVPARPLKAAKPKSGWADEMAPVPDARPTPAFSPRPLAADFS